MQDNIDTQIEDQLEAAVAKLELHNVRTSSIRSSIIDKLAQTFDSMTIDPNNDKASIIEAKMGITNTLLKALDDADNQKVTIIKLRQKMKTDSVKEDSVAQISQMVSAFMRKIDVISQLPNNSSGCNRNPDELLDEALATSDIGEILEGELELTTTCAKDIQK